MAVDGVEVIPTVVIVAVDESKIVEAEVTWV